uniref:Uncharacterized protein n=1 Tax=Meleagris gallopavo TaxID=9103 RepID=A0A803XU14_MELGA
MGAWLMVGILTPCNFLDANLPFQLLGLSIATLSTVTRYGLHFSIISNVALESNSFLSVILPAFYVGVFLSMTLILAALLSAVATVRESRCLTATVRTTFAHVSPPFYPHLPVQPGPVPPRSAAGRSSGIGAGNRTLPGGGIIENGSGWKGP